MYIITHRKRDGSIERRVESLDKSVSPTRRETDIKEGLALSRKALRNSRGWSKDKKMRLVARIPREVFAHVLLNEGHAAAADTKHVIRRAGELGINCNVSKGRY